MPTPAERIAAKGAMQKLWMVEDHRCDDGAIAYEIWTDDLQHRVCRIRDDDNPAAMRDAKHIVELHNAMFESKPATVA